VVITAIYLTDVGGTLKSLCIDFMSFTKAVWPLVTEEMGTSSLFAKENEN
jgi:hypothetical protein